MHPRHLPQLWEQRFAHRGTDLPPSVAALQAPAGAAGDGEVQLVGDVIDLTGEDERELVDVEGWVLECLITAVVKPEPGAEAGGVAVKQEGPQ